MKIISRCEQQAVVIGNDIVVTVLEVREDHVRVAISAPCETPSYWEQCLHVTGDQAERSATAEIISAVRR